MGPRKGRALPLGAAGSAVLVAAVALQGVIRELWTIHFELVAEDDGPERAIRADEWPRVEARRREVEARRRAAIRWLAARRSSLAARYLLEIAGREEQHARDRLKGESETSIQEEAEFALRQIPLGEDWYLARIRTGNEGARCLAIWILGDLGGDETVRRLQALAAEDAGLPGLEAARSIARILPALKVEAVSDRPLRVARLRLTNHAPRSIGFRGDSLDRPRWLIRETWGGEWVDRRKSSCLETPAEPVLLPGTSTLFEISFHRESKPFRIGISLEIPGGNRLKAQGKEIHRTAVWSPEILPVEAPAP